MMFRFAKPRTILSTILLPYMVILVMLMIIGAIAYGKIEESITRSIYQYNMSLLEQLQGNIDGYLSEIDTIAYHLSIDSVVTELMNNNPAYDQTERSKYYNLARTLKTYTIRSDYIYDIFLYFNSTDTVISSSNVSTIEEYFNITYKYIDYDYKQWYETFLTGVQYKKYFPAMIINTMPHPQYIITYAQSLPSSNVTDIKCYLIVQLNANKLMDLIKKVNLANNGESFIVDETGNTILSIGSNSENLLRLINRFNKSSDIYEIKDDHDNNIIMYANSNQNNWIYITIMPKMLFLRQSILLRKWSIGTILVFLLICAYSICWSIKNNYSPLKTVLAQIKKNFTNDSVDRLNEIDLIRYRMEKSDENEERLNSIIDNQMYVVKNNFLLKLMRGELDIDDDFNENLRMLKMKLVSDKFAIMLIVIENCESFLKNDSMKEWALVRFAIENIISEMVNSKNVANIVEIDKKSLAVMVNLCKTEADEFESYIKGLSDNFIVFLEKEFHIKVSISISTVHECLENIHRCYKEALAASNHRLLWHNATNVIYYGEIINNDIDGAKYYYPLEIENKILNYVNCGEFDMVMNLINDVLSSNFKSPNINIEIKQCLYYNLLATYMKVLNVLNIENGAGSFNNSETLGISEFDTIENAIITLKCRFEKLSSYLEENKKSNTDKTLRKVEKFVRENYMDSNLSINLIADNFSITPQYLSAFYKNKTGGKLIDFIAKVRIEKVKELLKNKKLTISDIAYEVGYANENGLIKMFKKHEGITPGKYRETLPDSD